MSLPNLLGWLAVALGTISTHAQYRRMSSAGIGGVSLATWVLFSLLSVFWTSYGLSVHAWVLAVGCVFVMPSQLLILSRLQPWHRWKVSARAVVLLLVICVLPGIAWGWNGAVVGAGAAASLTRAPQLIGLIKAHEAPGVSVGSWTLGVIGSSLWVAYYAGAHLWSAMVVTGIAGCVSVAIAVLSWWRHVDVNIPAPAFD
jgi:uncharacterized protein with PQ loop repeat